MKAVLSAAGTMLLAATLFAGEAHAQARRAAPAAATAGGQYSLIGGDTVGNNHDVISGEFGFPSVSLGYTHGMSPTTDIGAKFDLLYGVESVTNGCCQFGLGFRVPLRLTATRRDKLSVLVHIDPGVKLYTFSSTWFGFQFPVGLTLGYAAAPDLTVAFGVDLPMTIFVTPSPAAFYIAPLFGPAFEYHIDRQLAIGLNTRFGPVINTATPGVPGFPGFFSSPSSTNFGFVTQLLLAYRL